MISWRLCVTWKAAPDDLLSSLPAWSVPWFCGALLWRSVPKSLSWWALRSDHCWVTEPTGCVGCLSQVAVLHTTLHVWKQCWLLGELLVVDIVGGGTSQCEAWDKKKKANSYQESLKNRHEAVFRHYALDDHQQQWCKLRQVSEHLTVTITLFHLPQK